VPALLEEFGTYGDERYVVRIGSKVPIARREQLLSHRPFDASSLAITQLEVDFTDLDDIEALGPELADSIVFMGSDWMESAEEADARTLFGSLIVDERLRERSTEATVILELLDPDNASLVTRSRGELIVSPLVVSHLLTQVALRPELQSVFDELFTAGGAEITFHPVTDYADSGRLTFADLERSAAACGQTALGVRTRSSGSVLLNPPKDTLLEEPADLDLVALVTMSYPTAARVPG
jgi:hypothetical protein